MHAIEPIKEFVIDQIVHERVSGFSADIADPVFSHQEQAPGTPFADKVGAFHACWKLTRERTKKLQYGTRGRAVGEVVLTFNITDLENGDKMLALRLPQHLTAERLREILAEAVEFLEGE